MRTISVAPLIRMAVVGEKVPSGMPGNSTAGTLGQRLTKTVARMGTVGVWVGAVEVVVSVVMGVPPVAVVGWKLRVVQARRWVTKWSRAAAETWSKPGPV
ncbi:hypothetical protein [Rhodococcus sp. USK13]|uniref:hypothetical protein n=1 Tax=Rhodococcus sp. USK13 TaxID=2806442 RepID=UPI0020177844|nr:hypothetical protein [Rhodococcus sp. USK13]